MATRLLGTATTTSLVALQYAASLEGVLPADIATICNSILDDSCNIPKRVNAAFSEKGLLYIPNRGSVKIKPGDVVAVDSTGWPIILSARAAAASDWILT